MPASPSVIVAFLTVACGVAALALLGFIAAAVAGGPDHDERAAGRWLVLHGAAVIAIAVGVAAIGHHVAPIARAASVAGLGVLGLAAIGVGVVVTRRVTPPEPPEGGQDGDGGGGSGPDDDPGPQPPWWPQFERDLAAWQAGRGARGRDAPRPRSPVPA